MKTGRYSALFGAFLICLQTVALHAQSFSTLHNFSTNSDGSYPASGVVLCGGNLYGATILGDTGSGNNLGTVYSLCTNGSNYRILYSFSGYDGGNPNTVPVVSGGWIYGTTMAGGTNNGGVLYRVDTNGSNFSVLHHFEPPQIGEYPTGDLLLLNGMLFGTTGSDDGANYGKTIYSIGTNGSNFTTLYAFPTNEVPCQSRLAFSSGTLYGMTVRGGANHYGILFSIGTNGSNFNVLHSFTSAEGNPSSSPIISGTNLFGCSTLVNAFGIVFSIGIDGNNFNPLHTFTNGTDGVMGCALTLCSNTLYGVTDPYNPANTNNDYGTVFSVNTDGSGYNVLYTFTSQTNGVYPGERLTISGAQLFGITYAGGQFPLGGTVFSITLPSSQTGSPFFIGSVPLADDWNYLGAVGGDLDAFGYYSTLYFPYVYHMDLGWEYYIDAANANHGAYFYDFASGQFFYTEPAIFPYVYDFNQNAWMFCAPQNGMTDRYQSNPRWFLNMSTQVWTNSL